MYRERRRGQQTVLAVTLEASFGADKIGYGTVSWQTTATIRFDVVGLVAGLHSPMNSCQEESIGFASNGFEEPPFFCSSAQPHMRLNMGCGGAGCCRSSSDRDLSRWLAMMVVRSEDYELDDYCIKPKFGVCTQVDQSVHIF